MYNLVCVILCWDVGMHLEQISLMKWMIGNPFSHSGKTNFTWKDKLFCLKIWSILSKCFPVGKVKGKILI